MASFCSIIIESKICSGIEVCRDSKGNKQDGLFFDIFHGDEGKIYNCKLYHNGKIINVLCEHEYLGCIVQLNSGQTIYCGDHPNIVKKVWNRVLTSGKSLCYM